MHSSSFESPKKDAQSPTYRSIVAYIKRINSTPQSLKQASPDRYICESPQHREGETRAPYDSFSEAAVSEWTDDLTAASTSFASVAPASEMSTPCHPFRLNSPAPLTPIVHLQTPRAPVASPLGLQEGAQDVNLRTPKVILSDNLIASGDNVADSFLPRLILS